MSPDLLGLAWRKGRSDELRRPRGIVAASLVACGVMGAVSSYQTGIVGRLPDPPGRRLDSAAVTSSRRAYATLQAPDGVLGLASFAVTAALAATGSPERARHQPWLPLAMGAKVMFDLAQAGRLTYAQWREQRAFCTWCLTASLMAVASAAMAAPEVLAAGRNAVRRGAGR